MRWSWLFLLLGGGNATLSQQAPCRTPLGVPCYTLRGEYTQWQAFREGWTDIRQFKTLSLSAVRRDGSNVTVRDGSHGDLFDSAAVRWKTALLFLAPDKSIVTLNHTAQTISRREPLIWHDLPYRRSIDGDAICSSGIRHSGTDFTMAGTATVLGIPVVKWRRSLSNGGSEEQYLAPSLDCIALKLNRTYKNNWWIPTLIDSWEVTSVTLGEPAPGLFALPAGYRPVEDPRRGQLLMYLDASRRTGNEMGRR